MSKGGTEQTGPHQIALDLTVGDMLLVATIRNHFVKREDKVKAVLYNRLRRELVTLRGRDCKEKKRKI